MILDTYETSFTMRGTTKVILELYQILRLPRKMKLMIDPHHIWNVSYNARSNSIHPPTSPNVAPARQNDTHDWFPSHMKRHLQCAEQQRSPSNLTKYCACHANRHIWNVIYNARSNRQHPPNSPNSAPATKMTLPNLREICRERLKRRFHAGTIRAWSENDPTVRRGYFSRFSVGKITTCRAPAIYPNFTKYCAWHKKWCPNITKCCACH